MFDRKSIKSEGNGPIGLKIGIDVPYDLCYNFKEGFLDILLFSNFMAAEMH